MCQVAKSASSNQSGNTLNKPVKMVVTSVTFQGVVPLYYARFADNEGSYLVLPAADMVPPADPYRPVMLRPEAGKPHWKKIDGQTESPESSWPAVYVRKGAAGAAAPTLKASFELDPKPSGSTTVKIKSSPGLVPNVSEKEVAFTDGVAADVSFDIENMPATVRHLDGWGLLWSFDAGAGYLSANITRHTLFIVDEAPKKANNGYDDQYLWNILVWSCKWADGKTGAQNVLDAIWGHFKPVQSGGHDTGLVYWKNHENPQFDPKLFAQNLVMALQSRDVPGLYQNGASCIVFDRVLLNCLAAHGLASAEIVLRPHPQDPDTYNHGGIDFACTRWQDTTIVGQGNSHSPPFWGNHWIAIVLMSNQWKYYDASYGEGPVDFIVTAPANPVPQNDTFFVPDFEPHTVHAFECWYMKPPPAPDPSAPPALGPPPAPTKEWILAAPDMDINNPPHLYGEVLWTNS